MIQDPERVPSDEEDFCLVNFSISCMVVSRSDSKYRGRKKPVVLSFERPGVGVLNEDDKIRILQRQGMVTNVANTPQRTLRPEMPEYTLLTGCVAFLEQW